MDIFLKLLLCSLFLLQKSFTAECIGHRGNSFKFLENSLASITSAAQLPSHGVEFDIRHTSDQVAIIMHDETLKRVTLNNPDCPRNINTNQISFPKLSRCQLLNKEPIPTLEMILQILSGLPIKLFIEFKDQPTESDLALIDKYYKNKDKNIYLISFSASYLIWLYLTTKERNILKNATFLHLQKTPSLKTSFNGINIKYQNIDVDLISHLRKQKKKIGVWTVDDIGQIKKIQNLGVDYITTNNPKACLDTL